RLGPRRIGEALFTELVSGVSRGEIAAQTLERCGSRLARALRKAQTAIDSRSAARAASSGPSAWTWTGDERGSRPCGSSIARVWRDAVSFGRCVQGGYAEKETTSSAPAPCASADGA